MDGTSLPTPCRGSFFRRAQLLQLIFPGIDIAGKTGSAQIVSLATRAKFKNSDDLAQNGWFVGFTPRRNPDIVVCVLFQGGEHGRLAARLATQVIKAYVDKQNRSPRRWWRSQRMARSISEVSGQLPIPTETKKPCKPVTSFSTCRRSRSQLRLLRQECIHEGVSRQKLRRAKS